VSQDTSAKCAAAEHLNRSPTFVAYFSICTYFSSPFFHSHSLFFAIFGAACRRQNKTEQDYQVPLGSRQGQAADALTCSAPLQHMAKVGEGAAALGSGR
jgi:hypothetical protein